MVCSVCIVTIRTTINTERTKKFVICYKNKVKNIVEFTEKCEVELKKIVYI